MTAQGQTASGLAKMQEDIAVAEAIGGHRYKALTLLLVPEAYALDGQAKAGLDVLARALDFVNSRGLGLWEAEIHRLRGELLLAQYGQGTRPRPYLRRKRRPVSSGR
jgi:predicted ATPase